MGVAVSVALAVMVIAGLLVFTRFADSWEQGSGDDSALVEARTTGGTNDTMGSARPTTSGATSLATVRPTVAVVPVVPHESAVPSETTTPSTTTTLAQPRPRPFPPPSLTTTTLGEPGNVTAFRSRGVEYWCERNILSDVRRCVPASEPVPSTVSFVAATHWCDAALCYEYDPTVFVEIEFRGRHYICQRGFGPRSTQSECVGYSGGPPPIGQFGPELYCSADGATSGAWRCSTLWFPDVLDLHQQVTIDGADLLCVDASAGGVGDLDCYRYSGGDPSLLGGVVGAYCSSGLGCSTEWYPAVLDDFDRYTIGGAGYLCTRALTGDFGDYDCYRYSGGDPGSSMGLVDLYCSDDGGLQCDPDGYPSQWADYFEITYDFDRYLCDGGEVFGDIPCVRYWGGSPSGVSFFLPDLYCDRYGSTCRPA
ncbi:hypothetical protein BDK89_0328 [Ilumatobacter fluminis]|uniref:Uncharacterized protein n=1 Tax=Ilumatobacter fluminis TaxID=467091 RepID=A0A4R7HV15_9ACTN|nr:hypothetical protein BDK89_0328 [Ilumatobacter fluminis]